MVLLVFEAQTSIFVVLYQKTNHFNQKCCTVPKKPKTQMFLDHWPRTSLAQSSSPDPKIKKPMLFWYSTALFVKKLVFFLYSTAKIKVWASKTSKNQQVLLVFQDGRSISLVQYNKNGAASYKNQWNLMVLLVFEAQTCIFAVLYKKNQSFLPKVLYCNKKTKKNDVSRPLARGQAG